MKRVLTKDVFVKRIGLALCMAFACVLSTAKTTDVKAASYKESEPNDDRVNATKILTGNEYIGSIGNSSDTTTTIKDQDYYHYQVTENGYFTFTFGKELINADVKDGWVLQFYNGFDYIYSTEVLNTAVVTPKFNFKKGSNIYVVVKPKDSYYAYCPKGINYKLSVAQTKSASWEQEDNDVKSTATLITAGKSYFGNIATYDYSSNNYKDVDYYKFVVPNTGYFTVSMGKANADIDDAKDGWKVEIYSDDVCIYSETVSKYKMASPKFNLKKGSTVYIKIHAKDKYYAYCPTYIDYELKVMTTDSQYWEQESNDTMSTATQIKAGIEYYGNLMGKEYTNTNNNEVDYYKYTVAHTGYFTLNFAKVLSDVENVGDGWKIDIYNGQNLIYNFVVDKTSKTTPKFNLKKGSTVYIKVSPKDKYYAYCPTYVDYKLKITATNSTVWEQENNDTASTANAISLNKQYYGSLLDKTELSTSNKEKDYYSYKVPYDGVFRLSFGQASNTFVEVKDGWKVEIYENSKLLQTIEVKDKVVTSGNLSLTKGRTLYIKVSAKDPYYSYCPTHIDYKFKLTCSYRYYSISYQLNGGKNNASNKVKNAANKEVVLKNPLRKGYTFAGWYNGNKKVTKIAKGNTANISLTAKWTKTSVGQVKLSSVKNNSAKAMNIAFKSVNKAKGYEIVYSKDKNFKNKTTVNVSNAQVKTIKGLKKGTVYYVKVRAYTLDSTSGKVFGKYSIVKTIKIK